MLEAWTKTRRHSITGLGPNGSTHLLQGSHTFAVPWQISIDGNITASLRLLQETIQDSFQCRARHCRGCKYGHSIFLPCGFAFLQLAFFLIIRDLRLRDLLTAFHVWLVKRVHANDRARHHSCDLPTENLCSDIIDIRNRKLQYRMARGAQRLHRLV